MWTNVRHSSTRDRVRDRLRDRERVRIRVRVKKVIAEKERKNRGIKI